ncbi:MAG: oligosaccharide flippase family protein [Methylocystis sp.]|nr:oligosaccharide flippase family protein [Methylocystis sp.]
MKVLAAFFANTLANFVIGLLVAKFLGPEEYGRFALSFAIAAFVQMAVFDWLRLSATRFYSERARAREPVIRATLDTAFAVLAVALAIGTALFALFGPTLDFPGLLIILALVTAMANGLFDYSTALVRARFRDRLYGRLVVVKNILSFALTGGGAFLFHSAGMALAGSIASLLGTVITARAALTDDDAGPTRARLETARTLIAYGAPIIAANLFYQSIPLAARSFVANFYGFAETGQFSLAFDLGIRAVQALGSALDVVLFQIAVAAHEQHGSAKSREQIARNMSIVVAFLLPACVGVFFVLPSVEQLIVPQQYRGPFGHYLSLLLPGLFAMALVQYAINPVFQIAKKTAPLIAAAAVAVAAGLLLALVLPRGVDASSVALAQCGAYIVAFGTLIVFAARAKPQWPRARDILASVVATAAMAAALQPMRQLTPGLATLCLEVAAGIVVYGGLTLVFDTAGLRTLAVARLRLISARA